MLFLVWVILRVSLEESKNLAKLGENVSRETLGMLPLSDSQFSIFGVAHLFRQGDPALTLA